MDELTFIRNELARNLSPQDLEWLDKQESSLLAQINNELIKQNLL